MPDTTPPKTATVAQLALVARSASKFRQAQDWHAHLDNEEDPRDEAALDKASTLMSIAQVELATALAAIGDEYAARRLTRGDQAMGDAA